MKKLNEKLLLEISQYISRCQAEEGISPTFSEIAEKFNMTSKSTAHRYVHALANRGDIDLAADGSISMLPHLDSSYTTNIGLVGSIRCGEPATAIEDFESVYKFSKELTGEGSFFMLRAKGDSMINAGIYEGDYLIIRQQATAESGDIVAAIRKNEYSTDSGEATLKRFLRTGGVCILHPENEKYEDLDIKEYNIIGKLVGFYRKM